MREQRWPCVPPCAERVLSCVYIGVDSLPVRIISQPDCGLRRAATHAIATHACLLTRLPALAQPTPCHDAGCIDAFHPKLAPANDGRGLLTVCQPHAYRVEPQHSARTIVLPCPFTAIVPQQSTGASRQVTFAGLVSSAHGGSVLPLSRGSLLRTRCLTHVCVCACALCRHPKPDAKLLKRPPYRFLRDVVVEVRAVPQASLIIDIHRAGDASCCFRFAVGVACTTDPSRRMLLPPAKPRV